MNSPEKTPRLSNWRLSDLVDFEYFLHSDAQHENGDRDERDRLIYRRGIRKVDPGESGDPAARRQDLFWHWLRARRSSIEQGELLPGALLASVCPLIRNTLIAVGLFIGAGAAAVCLRYDGQQPVNVAEYFGVLIVPQLLLSAGAMVFFTFHLSGRPVVGVSFWQSVVQPLVSNWVQWISRRAFERRPASERNRLRAFVGYWGARHSLFDSVFYWPVFGMLQGFGVAFNIGVLAATLSLVVFSDRAFGWQSAVQFEPESIHSFVRYVSAPWSWAFDEGTGYPSLEQVEGTRIVLKEGIRELTTGSLVSWWPFLALAVFAYGLMPRLALLIGSIAAQNRNMRRIDFSYVDCDRLFERMTIGRLESISVRDETTNGAVEESSRDRLQESEAVAAGVCVLFVPADFKDRLNETSLLGSVSERIHWTVAEILEFRNSSEADQAAVRGMAEREWPDGGPRVLIAHESWRPPIDEFLAFVRLIRSVLGVKARITIGLFGKPLPGNKVSRINESDFRVWTEVLKGGGDPYLRLERLLPHA